MVSSAGMSIRVHGDPLVKCVYICVCMYTHTCVANSTNVTDIRNI